MRASRYEIFTYIGIVVVPVLMLLTVAALLSQNIYAYTVLPVLLALGLLIFSVTGIFGVYVHPKYPGSKKIIVNGESHVNARAPKSRHGKPISLILKRFNSDTKRFDSSTYKTMATDRTTVLGALLDIKDYQDNTVSVRCNCRMGICGSCGMVVNGKPVLACETSMLNAAQDGVVEVAPMLGHPLLKDVVTDFDDFFERHRSVEPHLYRRDIKEKYAALEEYRQSKEELDKFLPYSYCIMCGLCLDACPVVNTNPNFIGPQALSQTYRYYADSRDQKGKRRLFDIDSADGAWGCEFSGSCSKACPKGVDPASAIQMLKGDIMGNLLEKDE